VFCFDAVDRFRIIFPTENSLHQQPLSPGLDSKRLLKLHVSSSTLEPSDFLDRLPSSRREFSFPSYITSRTEQINLQIDDARILDALRDFGHIFS